MSTKSKPTAISQKEAVRLFLIQHGKITGSQCYKVTKQLCKVGSLNCHVLIRELKKDGIVFKQPVDISFDGLRYREHHLDRKKTPKKLLKVLA